MSHISEVIAKVKTKDAGQPEFLQAVEEVLSTLEPTVAKHPEFVKANIYERIVVPDRAILFRAPWVDDSGKVQVNRGYRVQFNNAMRAKVLCLPKLPAEFFQERSDKCLRRVRRKQHGADGQGPISQRRSDKNRRLVRGFDSRRPS